MIIASSYTWGHQLPNNQNNKIKCLMNLEPTFYQDVHKKLPLLLHRNKNASGGPDNVATMWHQCLAPGHWSNDFVFCSMRRNNDRDPKKQLNQKNINERGQKLDNGLLVTHVNQTQDLLVKTISASTEQPCSQIIAGNAECISFFM